MCVCVRVRNDKKKVPSNIKHPHTHATDNKQKREREEREKKPDSPLSVLQAHHNFFHDADKVIIDRLDGIRDQRFPQRSHGLLFFFNFYINYEHTHRTPDNIHTHSKPLRFNLLYEN